MLSSIYILYTSNLDWPVQTCTSKQKREIPVPNCNCLHVPKLALSYWDLLSCVSSVGPRTEFSSSIFVSRDDSTCRILEAAFLGLSARNRSMFSKRHVVLRCIESAGDVPRFAL